MTSLLFGLTVGLAFLSLYFYLKYRDADIKNEKNCAEKIALARIVLLERRVFTNNVDEKSLRNFFRYMPPDVILLAAFEPYAGTPDAPEK